MLSNDLKKGTSPKKKQDVKMLAIAAVAVLLMIGVLFWLFSGSSSENKQIQQAKIDVNTTKTQAEKTQPKPPVLNSQAIAMMNENDVVVSQSGINESPFSGSNQSESVNIEDSLQSNQTTPFNEDVINSLTMQSDYERPQVVNATPVYNADSSSNVVNESNVNNMKFNSLIDMKNYLNSIKKDIKTNSNSFEYDKKVYKKGDIFNSLNVVDLSKIYIRFSDGSWEYTLRFVGDR